MQFECSLGLCIGVFEGEVNEISEIIELDDSFHIDFNEAIPPHEDGSCHHTGENKGDSFSILKIGECGKVEAGGDHEGAILGSVSIKGFWFVDLDLVMVS